MAEKNRFYNDFSNRKPFNNIPCVLGEELVPVVLTDEMWGTLKPAGLDRNNIETWHFPHASEPIPVIFVPCRHDNKVSYMKIFNNEVERYLKHLAKKLSGDLSLDEFLESIDDEDNPGYDPTGTTEAEDTATLMYTFQLLLDQLAELDPKYSHIIELLYEGYTRKEIIEKIDLGKAKTQAYAYITKVQATAKEIYNRYYR